MKARTPALWAYLGLSAVAGPLYRLAQRRRLRQGKESADRAAERQGISAIPRTPGPLIWFHAASVGETLSILGLIERLLADRPNARVLVTSTTLTSAQLLATRLPDRAIHQFSPFDTPAAVRRFLDHWRPDLAIWIESELWPRLLQETYRRGVPMLLLNARVSDRTAARWRRWPRTARALLAPFRAILVQEAGTAALMRDLGVEAARLQVSGSLKEELPPPAADPADLDRMRRALGGRGCWLAASTHEGEEEPLLRAHDLAFGTGPEAPVLIIAPRHPERGPALAARLAEAGRAVALRSAGQLPDARTAIYIADTIGEMGLWYRLCNICFLGGSLARVGGHNPYEPILLDCAVIHGPHVFNFAGIYAKLAAAGAARSAATPEDVADHLRALQDGTAQAALTATARAVLRAQPSATDAALALIDRYLPPGGPDQTER